MKRFERRLLRFSLLGMAALLLLCGPAVAQKKGMTAEAVADLQRVGQTALHPDGKTIAYTVVKPRSDADAYGSDYQEVWVSDINGSDPRQFTPSGMRSSSIAWSPDGRYLTFLGVRKAFSDKGQIYKVPLNGGATLPITDHPETIARYAWSPDGKSIAFMSTDGKSPEQMSDEKAGKDWIVYDHNPLVSRLWVYDVASGESRSLSGDDLFVSNFTWSPNSKSIAFQAASEAGIDATMMFSKMYQVSLADDKTTDLAATVGKMGPMAYSPNGAWLAFLNAVDLSDPLAQSLFVVSTNGGEAKNLSGDIERSATGISWLNNKTILLQENAGTASALSRVDAKSGKRKAVDLGGLILGSVSSHAASGRVAVAAASPNHPPELFTGNASKGQFKRLTNHNPQLADYDLARQEVVTWEAKDGLKIEGVLTYPLNYTAGQAYPLILQIHGGPEGVSLNGWNTRPTYPVQVLAANGYMVLEPNYRGSGGRGVAFTKADHDDLGGKEFEDVLAGIDALVERGLVDNDRVGTAGWSYGGYFSAWAATKHSERFKAASAAAGLTNWISFSGTTDIPHEMALVHWNSYWYDQRDLHWERSPLYHIQNAKTPTLVVHGLKDLRVHPEQSMQLYSALKLTGTPSKLIMYPREPHGILERAHRIHYIENLIEWFNTYVKEAKNPEQAQRVVN